MGGVNDELRSDAPTPDDVVVNDTDHDPEETDVVAGPKDGESGPDESVADVSAAEVTPVGEVSDDEAGDAVGDDEADTGDPGAETSDAAPVDKGTEAESTGAESTEAESTEADSDDEVSDTEVPEPEPEPEPEPPTWTRIDLDDVDGAADAVLEAVESGKLIVLPTDTVYGVGADAYNSSAVASLLTAKGRGRDKPPPVLVSDAGLVKALAQDVPSAANDLMAAHWPGALTLILRATSSLQMDLGDTDGTVGVRVPDHPGTREILRRTGPLAVSSANVAGGEAATNLDQAIEQLGNSIALYIDGGDLGDPAVAPSTMVDFSKEDSGVIVRVGAISVETLRETVPGLTTLRPEDDPRAGLDGDGEERDESRAAEGEDSASAADDTSDSAPGEGELLPHEGEEVEAAAGEATEAEVVEGETELAEGSAEGEPAVELESSTAEPGDTEPADSDPGDSDPGKAEAEHAEPDDAEPDDAEPTDPATEPDPGEDEPPAREPG